MISTAVLIAIVLLVVALLLLVHHGWHHGQYDPPDSLARQESCAAVCFFQLQDIANHETWIVVCLTNAFSLAVLGPLISP